MDLLELRADQRAAQAKNEKAGEMFVFASKQVKCTRCGIVPRKPENNFYKKANSLLFQAQDGRICVCKDCAEKIFQDYSNQHDPLSAVMRFCCDFNYYYSEEIAKTLYDNCNFTIGNYLRTVNRSYKDLSFVDCISELLQNNVSINDASNNPEQFDRSTTWAIEDTKNRDTVISLVGYDPFIDGNYTDIQLKFLYNTSAGYITDAVEQDPHKLQNVILMVKTFLQLEIIDKSINTEFNSPKPDHSLIASYATMKEKLSNTITRIANENGFSEKTSGKSSQGSTTLSGKTKEMLDSNFAPSKVNIHNVRMAESFREIAKQNAASLIEELNLTGDDFARLLAEQRDFVTKLQDENESIEEENRLLRIKVKDLESLLRDKK